MWTNGWELAKTGARGSKRGRKQTEDGQREDKRECLHDCPDFRVLVFQLGMPSRQPHTATSAELSELCPRPRGCQIANKRLLVAGRHDAVSKIRRPLSRCPSKCWAAASPLLWGRSQPSLSCQRSRPPERDVPANPSQTKKQPGALPQIVPEAVGTDGRTDTPARPDSVQPGPLRHETDARAGVVYALFWSQTDGFHADCALACLLLAGQSERFPGSRCQNVSGVCWLRSTVVDDVLAEVDGVPAGTEVLCSAGTDATRPAGRARGFGGEGARHQSYELGCALFGSRLVSLPASMQPRTAPERDVDGSDSGERGKSKTFFLWASPASPASPLIQQNPSP